MNNTHLGYNHEYDRDIVCDEIRYFLRELYDVCEQKGIDKTIIDKINEIGEDIDTCIYRGIRPPSHIQKSSTERLERFILQNIQLNDCAVCYEPIQKVYVLECMHYFCKSCVQRCMMKNTLKCP